MKINKEIERRVEQTIEQMKAKDVSSVRGAVPLRNPKALFIPMVKQNLNK